MDKNYSDTFLARWLNNELSDEEKIAFEASEEFSIYNKIAKKSTEFVAPEFDKAQIFNNIQTEIYPKKQQKVISFFKPWVYGAAAAVVLLFSVFYYINQPEKYSTGIGEQLAVTLPDNSKVLLNANSTLEFSKKNWSSDRTLNLSGEGYFKVEKGSTFTVETEEGKVTVLGTQFNVKTDNDFFEVVCFEGKVKAETTNTESILTKGNAFRSIKNAPVEKWNIEEQAPSWKNGESSFNSAPLTYVINALENQYDIAIDATKVDVNKRFTGSFTHNNLQVALQTVFTPMKISVIFTNDKTILLDKQ